MTETAEFTPAPKAERRRKPEQPIYPQDALALGTNWPAGSGPEMFVADLTQAAQAEPVATPILVAPDLLERFPVTSHARPPFVAEGLRVLDAQGRVVCVCHDSGAPLESRMSYAEQVANAMNLQAKIAGSLE